jgi:hypothetical protein
MYIEDVVGFTCNDACLGNIPLDIEIGLVDHLLYFTVLVFIVSIITVRVFCLVLFDHVIRQIS